MFMERAVSRMLTARSLNGWMNPYSAAVIIRTNIVGYYNIGAREREREFNRDHS